MDKGEFEIKRTINERTLESRTHEIDHVRRIGQLAIALEIEWNSKDTSFDRDLENFKRLHSESAISLAVILTRGESFHDSIYERVLEFLRSNDIKNHKELDEFPIEGKPLERTRRQKDMVAERVSSGTYFQEAFARTFVADKYGEATTHWAKLQERLSRGLGSPCPLVLIAWPESIIK